MYLLMVLCYPLILFFLNGSGNHYDVEDGYCSIVPLHRLQSIDLVNYRLHKIT